MPNQPSQQNNLAVLPAAPFGIIGTSRIVAVVTFGTRAQVHPRCLASWFAACILVAGAALAADGLAARATAVIVMLGEARPLPTQCAGVEKSSTNHRTHDCCNTPSQALRSGSAPGDS